MCIKVLCLCKCVSKTAPVMISLCNSKQQWCQSLVLNLNYLQCALNFHLLNNNGKLMIMILSKCLAGTTGSSCIQSAIFFQLGVISLSIRGHNLSMSGYNESCMWKNLNFQRIYPNAETLLLSLYYIY